MKGNSRGDDLQAVLQLKWTPFQSMFRRDVKFKRIFTSSEASTLLRRHVLPCHCHLLHWHLSVSLMAAKRVDEKIE